MAWIRYADASAKYIFGGACKQGKAVKKTDDAARIVEFLRQRGCATRREITMECFRGHASKAQIDAAIKGLLNAGMPQIGIQVVPRPKALPGAPKTIYQLSGATNSLD